MSGDDIVLIVFFGLLVTGCAVPLIMLFNLNEKERQFNRGRHLIHAAETMRMMGDHAQADAWEREAAECFERGKL